MIRKLKIKFVALAMAALFGLLAVVVTGMNLINYASVVTESDRILSVLSQNKGAFPDYGGEQGDRFAHNFSPETPHESRYFSVLLNESNEIANVDTSKIASVDRDRAIEYGQSVINKGKTRGFADGFRYVLKQEFGGTRIVFLDCAIRLNAFYNFMRASVGMALVGLIVVFFIIFIMSGKIIKPIAESYEKQKRFITDAGHEIKTPLTIINANVDVLEMELGANESLVDIAQQAKKLCTLTNDLVMLARMEESGGAIQKIEFPISDVAAEVVQPFKNLAVQQGKEFVADIEPMLTLKGNDKAIEQLITILLDNALKYSPVGGSVTFSLSRQNRTIYLSAFNTTETKVDREQLAHVFDRFYRTDASRNSETGGHGIGLSVAQAIVTAHGGKIEARTQDGQSFQICATLPI